MVQLTIPMPRRDLSEVKPRQCGLGNPAACSIQ